MGRIIPAGSIARDQLDFYSPPGSFVRLTGISPAELQTSIFVNNSPLNWLVVDGSSVPDSSVVAGRIYFNEINGSPGFYSIRFFPDKVGFWRFVAYHPSGNEQRREFDAVPAGTFNPFAHAGLTATFSKLLDAQPLPRKQMINMNGDSESSQAAGLAAGASEHISATIQHVYHVVAHSADGTLKWEETFHNLVTTAGKNKYLDATLKTGLTTPAWYIGLVNGPGAGNTYAAADTMGSHAGWTENTTYSDSTRVAWTAGSISGGSVDNSGAPAVFHINGAITNAGGCFLADNSTKGGTTGTLLGVGSFTNGDRTALQSGDTLTVTLTMTIS